MFLSLPEHPYNVLSLWPLSNEVVAASHKEITRKVSREGRILLSEKLFDLFMYGENTLWNSL